MINPTIKISNLNYLDALQQLALNNLENLSIKPKIIILPFYNFVCKFIDILTQFSKLTFIQQKSEYQATNINSFIVDYYFRKFQQNPSEIYRQLFSFLKTWKKYTENHQQAKLFLTLLSPDRNAKDFIKQFLKFRKCILKSLNQKVLQQITINHQDALTISHTLYSHNLDIKSYATKKINQIFISLKRKLINNAKVNGAVICQFFMTIAQKFHSQSKQNPCQQQKKTRNLNFRQIQRKHIVTKSPLKYKNMNKLNPQKLDKSEPIKHNLSFSEQYASYYSPHLEYHSKVQIKNNEIKQSQFYSNNQQSDKSQQSGQNEQISQWKDRNKKQDAPIMKIRNSLTYFKEKDKQIDQRLKKYPKNCNQYSEQSQQFKQNIKYPRGWQNFIKTNEQTKRKLMNKHLPYDFQSPQYF